jgi:hypothetical protein
MEPKGKWHMLLGRRFKLREGTRLPYYEYATIPKEKLRDYVLDPEHEVGRHKAYVFASTLDIHREDWRYLNDQILERLPVSDATRVELDTPWGPKWEVPVMVEGRNTRRETVLTFWLIRPGEYPQLASARVDKPPRNTTPAGHALEDG